MKIKSKGYKWTPLERATLKEPSEELIQAWMTHMKIDRASALASMDQEAATTEHWINDLYQVQVRRHLGGHGMVHLNIRRRDGEACIRDWRHFQQIKNELIGPECEAIELYPAESRLVDTSNKYHLFGSDDPTFRFPVGFDQRHVDYDDNGTKQGGLKQRPMSMKLEKT